MAKTLKTWDFIYEDSNGNELQRKQILCFDTQDAIKTAFNIQQNSMMNNLADIKVQYIPIKWCRKCSKTGEGMDEGYCFGEGEAYFFESYHALEYAINLGYKTIEEAYEDEACIWTSWNDDYEYEEDENGVLTYTGE